MDNSSDQPEMLKLFSQAKRPAKRAAESDTDDWGNASNLVWIFNSSVSKRWSREVRQESGSQSQKRWQRKALQS